MSDQDNLLYAMQQRNLVYNYNFVNYSNKVVDTAVTYNHPDGWLYEDSGSDGQISFDPGTNSCIIVKSKGDDLMTFSQSINEFPRYTQVVPGNRVSACAVVNIPGESDGTVTFLLTDGDNTSSLTEVIPAGKTVNMEIGLDVGSSTNHLSLSLQSSTASLTIYIHKVYANVGEVALETLPCVVEGTIGERKQYMSTENPPSGELSLCQPTAELSSSYTRLSSFLDGKFGTGSNGLSMLPDMSGYFSRAWDNGAGVDPNAANDRTALGDGSVKGDNVGTVQEDQVKEHTHSLDYDDSGEIPAGTAASLPSINKAVPSETGKYGGVETRSKNISELYTMKWA
ncbi:hypothetical protein KFE98_17300 [bacterium SCSIO 12741]|nr:hypothetical protein KFE98_17300 [bacterium SCSIO 12741]